jgi:hypothetical protein
VLVLNYPIAKGSWFTGGCAVLGGVWFLCEAGMLNVFKIRNKPCCAVLCSALLQVTVAKQQLQDDRRHFDVVVACEDEEQEDLDVPLISIRYK